MKKIYILAILLATNLNFSFAAAIETNSANASSNREDTKGDLSGLFSFDVLLNIILSILVLVLTVLISKIVKTKLLSFFENKLDESENGDVSGLILRVSNVIIWMLGFTISLGILGVDLAFLMGGLGIGLGFTLQVFLSNFLAGLIMIFGGEYKTGNLIEINGKMGYIKNIGTMFSSVDQFDGVKFYVPNIKFLQDVVICFSANNKRRTQIEIRLDYLEDFAKVKNVITKILDNIPGILKAPYPKIIFDSMGNSGVSLKIWYWIGVDGEYFQTKSNVIETLNHAFGEMGIRVSYEQILLKKAD